MEYDEPEKRQAREACLGRAIELLTERRAEMPLVRKTYVQEVRDYLMKGGSQSYDRRVAAQLSDETVRRWEHFHGSIVGVKSPAELRVAYLAGPNPENDLRTLTSLGVLPEHVWAFESDVDVFDEAVISALNSEFPYIKLFSGKIDSFISVNPTRFDLIYLDFCGPIPGRQKALQSLSICMLRHALVSPGILIVNSSFPSKEQDENGWEARTNLISKYLYPKGFLEFETEEGEHGMGEGAIFCGHTPEAFLDEVRADSAVFYGQFVSRLVVDMAAVLCPYQSLATSRPIWGLFCKETLQSFESTQVQKFFHVDKNIMESLGTLDESESFPWCGGDVVSDPDAYPLLWTLASLSKTLNQQDEEYPQDIYLDEKFGAFADSFLAQLSENGDTKNISRLCSTAVLLAESSELTPALNSKLAHLAQFRWESVAYQFCDLVLGHQIKEFLLRQLAVPYHSNTKLMARWSYRAKKTDMFLDMHVLDECRYVYDWMPSIDQFEHAFADIEQQLAFRFALDGMQKHSRWLNHEFFAGTAVVDQFEEGFEAIDPPPRISLSTQSAQGG